LIGDSRWYRNLCTDNVHMLPDDKHDDGDGDEADEEGEMEYVLRDIYDKLYDYQHDCLVWFWKAFQSNNGGILGDDMGLGKTVQMAAFLHGLFYSGLIHSVLLIVPVSVMHHWLNELDKWCFEGAKLYKYHSSLSKKKRDENLTRVAKKGGVLITTYGMIQKNYASMDIATRTRKQRKWDYMILDEGHKIKNHLIGTSKAVRQIPVENSNKIILSGTFLQNELSELWSLFDFISEGKLFGSYRAFNSEFACKINAGRLKNASRIQKQLSVKLTNIIKKTIAPYLLQRTKQEIRSAQEHAHKMSSKTAAGDGKRKTASLTPVFQCQKRELVIWVKLSAVQTELYRTFLESPVVKETLNTTKSPLAALTVLKKICDHPFLLSDKMANCQQLTQLSEITHDKSIENTLRTSTKMYVLFQVLQRLIADEHRTLVFSQSKTILSMIESLLKPQQIRYLRMDGDTEPEKRQKFVDTFNQFDKLKVFLLSTRVGGLGLNLIGSDRVIIFDPSWNPAIDAQAVDRSYRIGQTKDVMVYRFVTCGTIEEKIYRRQISKVGLLKSVTGNSNQHRYFSKAELKSVFALEDPNESQTARQFEHLHEHRMGINVAFDREEHYLSRVQHVFGLSHHDLLFKTCPSEELEDNPELAAQIEAARKKLMGIAATPKPKPKPAAGKSMTSMTAKKVLKTPSVATKTSVPKTTVIHRDRTPFKVPADISMIQAPMTTKTRKLNTRQRRFIADSDSDENVDDANLFSYDQRDRKFEKLQFTPSMSKQAPKSTKTQIDASILMQTPILQSFKFMNHTATEPEQRDNTQHQTSQFEKKEENAAIEVSEIAKIIRSQPRKKRKQSLANLQQMMAAQESDDGDENQNEDEENDSEATESEPEQEQEHEQPRQQQKQSPTQLQHAQLQQFSTQQQSFTAPMSDRADHADAAKPSALDTFHWNFNASLSQSCMSTAAAAVDDDEETASDSEQEMIDLSRSKSENPSPPKHRVHTPSPPSSANKPTLATIFDEADKMEKYESSIEPDLNHSHISAHVQHDRISSERQKHLSSNFKRYRRKSFIPQIEDYDDYNDEEDEETEDEQQDEHTQTNHNNGGGGAKVCDMHRNKLKEMGFDCTKCQCFLTSEQQGQYEQYLRMAEQAEHCENWQAVLQALMQAVSICNQDPSVHEKCNVIAKQLGLV